MDNITAPSTRAGLDQDPFARLLSRLNADVGGLGSILSEADLCYVLARQPDGAQALSNIASPGSFNAIVSGSPVFTPGRGYAFGAGNALDTGWDPSIDGVHYQLNSASHWLWSLTSAQSSLGAEHGSGNARMQVRNTSDQIGGGRINDATSDAPTVTDGSGLFGAQRRSATDKRFWRNGVQIGAFNRPSTAISSGHIWIGGQSAAGGSTREITFDFWGGPLIGKEAELYAALSEYMTAMVGNPALPTAYSLYEGDVFSLNLQEVVPAVSYALTSGGDSALFAITFTNLLGLPAQVFATPTDANHDNVYVAPIQATTSDGKTTSFAIQVTQKQLTVGAPVHRFILPSAAGSGDGTSWGNAGPLSKLDAFVRDAGPGGFINIGSQNGPYTNAPHIFLAHGGAKKAPVTVRGVDAALNPSKAILQSTRTVWSPPSDPEQVTNVTGWSTGSGGILSLTAGANNITFDQLRFEHCGNAFSIEASVYEITLQNFEWLNVARLWEQSVGVTPWSILIKIGSGVGYSNQLFRIRGYAHDVAMQDVTGDSRRQTGGNFAVGVQMSGKAHDISFLRCIMNNAHDDEGASPSFWNGDGFSSEVENYNITFEACEAHGNTDAGFDCKGVAGKNFTFINCISQDNKNNYKLWGNNAAGSANFVLQGSSSRAPHRRGGGGAANHIDGANGAAITVKAASELHDTDGSEGARYVMENRAGAYHVASDTVEQSLKPRTAFVHGTTIDNVVP